MFRITPYSFKPDHTKGFGVVWSVCSPLQPGATFTLECFNGKDWQKIDNFNSWSEAWDIMLTISAQLETISVGQRLNKETGDVDHE